MFSQLFQSQSSPAAAAATAQDCARWARQVQEVQSRRSPQEVEAAQQRIEQARRCEASHRMCSAAKGHSVRSRTLALEGLRQMSSVSAAATAQEYEECSNRWMSAQAASNKRQHENMARASRASAPAAAAAFGLAAEPAVLLRSAEEEEDEAMEEAAQLMGADDVATMTAIGAEGLAPVGPGAPRAAGGGAVQELLQQLRDEPRSDAECAAKFMLYEGYGREVADQRTTLLKLHEDSRETLPAAVLSDMGKKIRTIDSHEAMGIPDDAREWFVYHMMRRAERNNFGMAKMLEEFEKKLAFLAKNDQPECPVCLERFADSGPRAAETLGCCHKVCHECWVNWSAVMHGHPFCPLCRRSDFLVRVTEAGA